MWADPGTLRVGKVIPGGRIVNHVPRYLAASCAGEESAARTTQANQPDRLVLRPSLVASKTNLGQH